jgi:glycosyltransferase involved in cell wall biosynthesis
MRIALVTDAWTPQVNGVVNTLMATEQCLRRRGHEVLAISPEGLRTFGCPTYPEIRLAYKPYNKVAASLDRFEPDCIHIATEGPMGLAARRYCLHRGLDFTTAYHTRFPEYVRARSLLPLAIAYRWVRWFHAPAKAVMVPTPRIKEALARRGFRNTVLWGRGVDTAHFAPRERDDAAGIARPLYLYVGRLSVEKNIEAFLEIDLPGTKWVIGDGPLRETLERKYPGVRFLGAKPHQDLPPYYSCADVFVFPSRTDTFGLVLVEAMACGVPVAAYPVEGPIDVVAHDWSGILHHDLTHACRQALMLNRTDVRAHALGYSWEAATDQFLRHLYPVRPFMRCRIAPAGPHPAP